MVRRVTVPAERHRGGLPGQATEEDLGERRVHVAGDRGRDWKSGIWTDFSPNQSRTYRFKDLNSSPRPELDWHFRPKKDSTTSI